MSNEVISRMLCQSSSALIDRDETALLLAARDTLGLFSGRPWGARIGTMQASQLFAALQWSRTVQTLKSLEKCELMIDGVAQHSDIWQLSRHTFGEDGRT